MTMQPSMDANDLLMAGGALGSKAHTVKRSGTGGKPHCVHRPNGSKESCHPTREEAQTRADELNKGALMKTQDRELVQALRAVLTKADETLGAGESPNELLDAAKVGAGVLVKADAGGGDDGEDAGRLAEALDQVLDNATERFDAGDPDQARALVSAASTAVDALLDVLGAPDDDEAGGEGETEPVSKAARVAVLMPDRYGNSPVPIMDPDDEHAYIGHAKDPGKCAVCGQGLGHDKHWQMPGIYKGDDEVPLRREEAGAFWVTKIEKDEGGKAVRGLVYGVVLNPDLADSQGDAVTRGEIEKAAHDWMRRSQQLGNQHVRKAGAAVVESYLAPVSFSVTRPDGSTAMIPEGAWVTVSKVDDPKLLDEIVTGKKSGLSIGGSGIRQKRSEDT